MRKIIFAVTFTLNLSLLLFSSASADTHTYFDWLSGQSQAIVSKAYRTQSEINADPYGGAGNVVYDASEDAARFTLPAGNGSDDASIPLHDQLRPTFQSTSMTSSNLFLFYELMHESGFVANGDVDGLEKHKATQIAKDTSRHQCIEPRYRYDLSNSPYVAKVDVRLYGKGSGYTEGANDSIGPQTGQFSVLPNVWTRHWVFVDIANDKLWYWVGDENRSNVTILNGVHLDCSVVWPGDNFMEFWFEFNSSQQRDRGSPALDIWARNLVILKGISNAASLVAQGDSGSGSMDTEAPNISITSPNGNTFDNGDNPEISISGNATDNKGISSISWTNAAGGSGVATGRESWSIASINLSEGTNAITVTAYDTSGNTASDVISVIYTPTVGDDDIPPGIEITSPATASYDNGSDSTISLAGTASDNIEVASVSWTNAAGGSGAATGRESWSIASINLSEGTNVITLTAYDTSGNTASDVIRVIYTPTVGDDDIPPGIEITSPSTASFDNGSNSTISLAGTASDNIGVVSVSWANAAGGSGIASGTENWNIVSIGLSLGSNLITVTARDEAGNSATDYITVTYAGPSSSTGETYYIDAVNGDDRDDGLSVQEAWETLDNLSDTAFGPGDRILLKRGSSWSEDLRVRRNGNIDDPITFGAFGDGEAPVVEGVSIDEADYIVIEDIIVDRQKENIDAFRIRGSQGSVLRRVTIRNGTRDGLDIARSTDIVLDSCKIHHFLAGSFSEQVDAHGIVIVKSERIAIENSEIHQVSGDSVQVDPNRDASNLSNDITIEGCHFWTGPLTENFNSGWVRTSHLQDGQKEYPGENAVDTKVLKEAWETHPRMRVKIRNTTVHGWKNDGYVDNKAALNLKEYVEVEIDGVTVYDSEIGFRLRGTRGNANVTVKNAVVYNCEKAIRAEDDLENLKFYNSTFGADIDTQIQFAGGSGGVGSWSFLNNAFVDSKPSVASSSSNHIVYDLDSHFVDAISGDYSLKGGSTLIESGQTLEEIQVDRNRNQRTIPYDVGAYEFSTNAAPHPSAPKGLTIKPE